LTAGQWDPEPWRTVTPNNGWFHNGDLNHLPKLPEDLADAWVITYWGGGPHLMAVCQECNYYIFTCIADVAARPKVPRKEGTWTIPGVNQEVTPE
jgi:hypothetical protein